MLQYFMYKREREMWLADDPVAGDLSGQTWLVTGASGGIGREIALSAARLGARVIAVARKENSLAELGEAIKALELSCPTVGRGSLQPHIHRLTEALQGRDLEFADQI